MRAASSTASVATPRRRPAGGTEADDAEDYGFMYSRSFFDLDGHGRQVMWMDPAAAQQGPEASAASLQDADAPA
jgi:predicted lactoylglutathione lyase